MGTKDKEGVRVNSLVVLRTAAPEIKREGKKCPDLLIALRSRKEEKDFGENQGFSDARCEISQLHAACVQPFCFPPVPSRRVFSDIVERDGLRSFGRGRQN